MSKEKPKHYTMIAETAQLGLKLDLPNGPPRTSESSATSSSSTRVGNASDPEPRKTPLPEKED